MKRTKKQGKAVKDQKNAEATQERQDTQQSDDQANEGKNVVKKKVAFKDRLFLRPEDQLLQVYDTYMLLVIAYSCFTSAYFVAFSFPDK